MGRLMLVMSAIASSAGLAVICACSSFAAAEAHDGDAGPDAPSDSSPTQDARSPYEEVIRTARPIAYWRMGVKSGLIIADESGHNNNLVLQGADGGYVIGEPGAIAGDNDTAIRFDGKTGTAFATMPRAFDFPANAPFTLELWAKRDAVDGGAIIQHLVDHTVSAADGGRLGFELYFADVATQFSAFEVDSVGGRQGAQGPPAGSGAWAHYAGVLDAAGSMTLYVNAMASTPVPAPGPLGGTTAKFILAAGDFAGTIDEVAVYDRALGLEEIAAHKALGQP